MADQANSGSGFGAPGSEPLGIGAGVFDQIMSMIAKPADFPAVLWPEVRDKIESGVGKILATAPPNASFQKLISDARALAAVEVRNYTKANPELVSYKTASLASDNTSTRNNDKTKPTSMTDVGGVVAAGAAEAGVEAVSFSDTVVDHMTFDMLLDGAGEFLQNYMGFNRAECKWMKDYAAGRMKEIYSEPAMQKLGTAFTIASGATIAQGDKSRMIAGMDATADAIKRLQKGNTKVFDKFNEKLRLNTAEGDGQAAGVLYDADPILQNKIRGERIRNMGQDQHQERSDRDHYTLGIQEKSEHFRKHGMHPDVKPGETPVAQTQTNDPPNTGRRRDRFAFAMGSAGDSPTPDTSKPGPGNTSNNAPPKKMAMSLSPSAPA